MTTELDIIDQTILDSLQKDARMKMSELAKRVELSAPGLQKRIRKLEESGVIKQYITVLDPEVVGYDMLCFVQVTLRHHVVDAVQDFRATIMQIPEVLECHHIAGEFDYLLRVLVRNRKHLERFLLETLTPISGVDKIRTNLVLSEVKRTHCIPL